MRRIFFLALLFCSCSPDQKKLVGAWQALAYYETGQSVNIPLDSVRLNFSLSNDYSFNSIGTYQEKGLYRLSGKYLFLRDTTVQDAPERTLRIHTLSEDSLKIEMESGGKEQAVFFGRIH